MKSLLVVALILSACSTSETPSPKPTEPITPPVTPVPGPVAPKKPVVTESLVAACMAKVYNRGKPKFSVVKDIIEAVRAMPESAFAPNDNADVYSSVYNVLGPWHGNKHRAAVMADVMIVQAGFESSWGYQEGRDASASNISACTEEAGLYQTSGNMNTFNAEAKSVLIPFQAAYCKSTTCDEFRRCTKEPVKIFTHGHFILASRITTKHWGPMVRKEINPWLKKECVSQVEQLL